MKKLINPVKGTRDFYPQDKSVNSWLYRRLDTRNLMAHFWNP